MKEYASAWQRIQQDEDRPTGMGVNMLYKTLAAQGYSGLGRPDKFVGKLPNAGQPGAWAVVEGALQVNTNALDGDNGIHLASRKWIVRYLCEHLYEAEYDGDYVKHGRFLVARKVRLLRKLDNWNKRTARLFAADCAERVLDFYQRKYPGDPRPEQAIHLARRLAKEEVEEDDEAVEQARQAAFAALEDAANNTPAKSAALAAQNCLNVDQSAASVAREVAQTALGAVKAEAVDCISMLLQRNRKREMAWQSRRLLQIAYGPLPRGY